MKDLLKFITCGSVDDGKSTLIGHILYDAKLLYADQKRALELDSKVGSRGGAIDYSLLLDGLMAEREQGITIDVAYRYFTTDNRSFIVADTPGHEEYTRNMAVGASFADLSIILIDAKQGVLVQTKRHARICELMGIKHFVFAINKMDLVGYSEERFIEIEKEVLKLQEELSLKNIATIPLSATEGDNVTSKSENTPWYNGMHLLEYLENVEVDDISEEGFYMPVQRVCRPDHTFRGFQGQIESGSINVGDEITALPSNEKVKVKSIHVTDKSVSGASKGQPVTIQLDKEVDVSRGCILIKGTDIKLSNSFTTEILWMDDSELICGKEYIIKIGTKMLSGIVTELKYKIDVNSGEHLNTQDLKKNEIAVCNILLSEKVAADEFTRHKNLGEFILIDRITNMTSACGVIKEISSNKENKADNIAFKFNDLQGRGDIFEEFYYNTESLSVYKYRPVSNVYTIGDEIPVKGESYEYPESFDILILRDKIAISVRNRKISTIKSIDEYKYSNYKVINGRGFAIKANSQDQIERLLDDRKNMSEGDFMEKWFDFETYRKVKFH
ncbi:sulfate adenylyltransferase subunit 1 [Clostridium butyricum]|uniref:sulfate adenylyltransferase n=1 Tax=Clostridium butyricum E4 str. BoNT E BL5262 TaxID=632245 RepID=C4IIM1_CLOBU|nr:GTP-binding protein [Clostridium butyricum]EDT76952.1 sulfate adenylyltransferase subunit 1 [Clostridium butyricum 5521]EEP53982.1 bifunctional enzyme CysN/cysC [Clostridium butyricum E4 str. BoNT E BL5262]NFL31009.1 GTP-binding protein [Clostridium butyricum]NFS20002.1 GTP-binding protein [Clostridium butyricum]